MGDFEQFYEQYFNDVYRYLRGLTANESLAEELTQEAFYKSLRSIDHFKGDCDIRVWLCQIAKNCYFSYLKKHKRITTEEELENIKDVGENFEQILANKEMAFQIHKLIHEMQDPYKEVFSLRVFGELSFKQIAALFGKTEHWACVTYHRAKSKIQDGLEENI